MVCEIIVSHKIAFRIEIYIKYKISHFRDWNVIAVQAVVAGYEFLDDLDEDIDPSAKNGVIEIYIREDPLK